MRILIIIICSLFISNAYASIYCPATITCNYEAGTCDDITGWSIGGTGSGFTGTKTMYLSKIWTMKLSQKYMFNCIYDSNFMIQRYVEQLIGDGWTFSGFGKSIAECSNVTRDTNNPQCSAE